MIKNVEICPFCHQKIVQYRHGLTLVLVRGLFQLYKAGGKANLNRLNLTHSEFNNFQKLHYFGLVISERSSNQWIITEKGRLFMEGKASVEKYVITQNARIIGKSDEKVFIQDVKEAVQYKIDWQQQAATGARHE